MVIHCVSNHLQIILSNRSGRAIEWTWETVRFRMTVRGLCNSTRVCDADLIHRSMKMFLQWSWLGGRDGTEQVTPLKVSLCGPDWKIHRKS